MLGSLVFFHKITFIWEWGGFSIVFYHPLESGIILDEKQKPNHKVAVELI